MTASNGAIVLAAGTSQRMGETNKLLAPWHGKPLVSWVIEAARESRAEPIIVVLGHQADQVKAAVGDGVVFVDNPDYASGMASSLKAGVAALPAACDGFLVLLGDMPHLRARHIDAVIDGTGDIRIPVFDGRRGHPVFWHRRFIPEFALLSGDHGAKGLIGLHPDCVEEVPIHDDAVLLDVDRPEDLQT